MEGRAWANASPATIAHIFTSRPIQPMSILTSSTPGFSPFGILSIAEHISLSGGLPCPPHCYKGQIIRLSASGHQNIRSPDG